jgi:ribosomal protein S18 acetylase RimI-like enzyme
MMLIDNPTISWLSTIRLRYATRDDLPALEWNGEFTHFRRLYQEIYQNVSQGRALMWVVDIPENGIVGQLFVQLESHRQELADGRRRAYIYGFRIQPAYRDHRVGSRLLEKAEVDLIKRRFRWVALNVGRQNLKALRFYERHGYRIIAADPGQWSYVDHQGHHQEVCEPAWRIQKCIS